MDEIVEKNKSFENREITKVFPGVGEKSLLFNAMRMDQPDIKKQDPRGDPGHDFKGKQGETQKENF